MEPAASSTRLPWSGKRVRLAAGALLVVAVGVLVALKMEFGPAVGAVVAGLREAGPAVFFVAMAVLPAVGFPMMAFTLAVGPVFGPGLGPGWAVAWALLAVLANLLLSYWLADRALRPLAGRLLGHFDFHLPVTRAGDTWQTILIVRLAPGPPFWAHSYLLGLLHVPLGPYLAGSMLVMTGYIVALVYGGEALTRGNGPLVFAAAGLLVATVAALQLLRRRLARRSAPAAPSLPPL